nr:hypothetical protein [uncultured bacterium]
MYYPSVEKLYSFLALLFSKSTKASSLVSIPASPVCSSIFKTRYGKLPISFLIKSIENESIPQAKEDTYIIPSIFPVSIREIAQLYVFLKKVQKGFLINLYV